jgi:steroid delta-isomerase-like uncharacterized protein
MSEQENKALNERFFAEVFNGHNVDAIDELLSEDFIEHAEFPGFTQDREGAKQFFAAFFQAFPDLTAEIEDMVASGDRVGIRSTFRGTHQGDFLGVPATGRQVAVGNMDIVRVVDGKATDHWGISTGWA